MGGNTTTKNEEMGMKLTVLVVGTTSSGKTAVLDALTKSKSSAASEELTLISRIQNHSGGYTIDWVEVPDVSRVVNSLQETSMAFMKDLHQLCLEGVNAVLYCYPITHMRCDSDKQRVLQLIAKLFKVKMPELSLVFTFCSMLRPEELAKAKLQLVPQIVKHFEAIAQVSVIRTEYFDSLQNPSDLGRVPGELLRTALNPVKATETWANVQMFIEQERRSSCEMLLEFADIMEEEKKLAQRVPVPPPDPTFQHNHPNEEQDRYENADVDVEVEVEVDEEGDAEVNNLAKVLPDEGSANVPKRSVKGKPWRPSREHGRHSHVYTAKETSSVAIRRSCAYPAGKDRNQPHHK